MRSPFLPTAVNPRFTVLLLVTAAVVTAVQWEAWASALQPAAAVYAAVVAGQNRGSDHDSYEPVDHCARADLRD
ncbi:hypothetical protein [Streptomyces sp. LN549]|uniref:hypothetical protein n=1 Tax=Streptomyces sp. LN549 TaxID=3112979 RepID=UPI00371A9CCA